MTFLDFEKYTYFHQIIKLSIFTAILLSDSAQFCSAGSCKLFQEVFFRNFKKFLTLEKFFAFPLKLKKSYLQQIFSPTFACNFFTLLAFYTKKDFEILVFKSIFRPGKNS